MCYFCSLVSQRPLSSYICSKMAFYNGNEWMADRLILTNIFQLLLQYEDILKSKITVHWSNKMPL